MAIKKYLVIGNPIDHSLSPKLHNFWIKKYNIDAEYTKFLLDEKDLNEIVNNVRDNKLAGFNVINYISITKEFLSAISHCDNADIIYILTSMACSFFSNVFRLSAVLLTFTHGCTFAGSRACILFIAQ